MKVEWISCNTCGVDKFKKLAKVQTWDIGECGDCGLIYVNPTPFFEPNREFSDISREFTYTRYMHEKIRPEILAYEKNQLLANLEASRRMFGHDVKNPRFLDVGCGSGGSVRAAADLGWKATGVDIDPDLIRIGREQLGDIDLRCTPLLDSGLEENQFDFIRLRDVIEHLPNPYATLGMVRRLLTGRGVVLISTPNEGSMTGQLRMLLKAGRDAVAAVNPPHHIHGFKPETLKRILARAGFANVSTWTTTPVDPSYVTTNNMKAAAKRAYVMVWQGAKTMGRGSMLIGWAARGA